MNLSKNGIEFIKQWEGCRLTAYKAVPTETYWTIGYGHYGADVHPNMSITQEQAEAFLQTDLAKFETNVRKYDAIYHWNQNEYDALVSFAYNVGSIDQLTTNGTRDRTCIAEKMLLYCKSGGNTLVGLVRRRTAEQQLFLKPVEGVKIDPNKAEWVCQDGKYWYRHADGSYTKDNWEQIDGKWFYFDSNGWMQTGWISWQGKWYYCNKDGVMASNQILIISDSTFGDEVYAFSEDGHMLKQGNSRGALV